MNDFQKRKSNFSGRSKSVSVDGGSGNRGKNKNSKNVSSNSKSYHGSSFSTSASNNGVALHRQPSMDYVRQIVLEEGRSARNLLNWNVPMDNTQLTIGKPKLPASGRQSRLSSSSQKSSDEETPTCREQRRHCRSSSQPAISTGARQLIELRASLNRRTVDLRARYWAFLFENLQRAVDEIYQTCEVDESVVECKEVIMMLEHCTKDFNSLIERFDILRAYEDAEEGHRPRSLAWDVRKMSPGKNYTASKDKTASSPKVVRKLNYHQTAQPGNSWADRVRGVNTKSEKVTDVATVRSSTPINMLVQTTIMDDKKTSTEIQGESQDDGQQQDGCWETVQRRSRHRCSSQSSSNSNKTPQESSRSAKPSPKQPKITPPAKCPQSNPMIVDNQIHHHNNTIELIDDPAIVCCVPGGNDVHVPSAPTGHTRVLMMANDSFTDNYTGDRFDKDDLTDDELCDSTQKRGIEQLKQAEQQLADTLDDALAVALVEEDELVNQIDAEQEVIDSMREQMTRVDSEQDPDDQGDGIQMDESNAPGEDGDSELNTTASSTEMTQALTWEEMVQQNEEFQKAGGLWSDDVVETPETRTPGRVVHIHEKLSSPSRKSSRSLTESKRRHELKQAKAHELREKLLQEKSERLRMLTNKVSEVRMWKDELMDQRKDSMERKLQRAEEKRQLQLRRISKKAREEEAKANEIAFINSLEADNKRLDLQTKQQECEARLQELQEERQRKHEEKAAKEAAVEERRKALEAERQAKLEKMQEKRRQRTSVYKKKQAERDKERAEAARAKELNREERLAAINAQQQAHIEELQKKIQLKQEESARRQKENLDQVREKAFEMSLLKHSTEDHRDAPKSSPYETAKLCDICNVLITSEIFLLSHLRGKQHQHALKDSTVGRSITKAEIESFNLRHITDAPSDRLDPRIVNDKERQKVNKKRCKILRQQMALRGEEYEKSMIIATEFNSQHRSKLQKAVKDITKLLQAQDTGPWQANKVSNLERCLGEVGRILEKKGSRDGNTANEQSGFRALGGLAILCRILMLASPGKPNLPSIITEKALVHVCNVFRQCCRNNYDNCHYVLFTNKIGTLVDQLMVQLSLPATSSNSDVGFHNPLSCALMQLLATILSCLGKKNCTGKNPSETNPSQGNPSEKNSSRNKSSRRNSSGKNASASKPKSDSKIVKDENSKDSMSSSEAFNNRTSDVVSYLISTGVVDKLATSFSNMQGPLDSHANTFDMLQHSIGLLMACTRVIANRNHSIFTGDPVADSSELIITLQETQLVGVVSLMYGILLHTNAPSRSEGGGLNHTLPLNTIQVVTLGIRLLNYMATLDLSMLQKSLGGEGTWLELRHIASYLLWYSQQPAVKQSSGSSSGQSAVKQSSVASSGGYSNHIEELLHELILCVGYFVVLCPDNQLIIQSGQPPTVLQQLCQLPFQYFSDPALINVLFPTLISCCYECPENKLILEEELSGTLLANYIEEKTLELQHQDLLSCSLPEQETERDNDRSNMLNRFPHARWPEAMQYYKS